MLTLSAGGLFEGLVLLVDDQTETYWDHITGEGVYGPLTGVHLETWPLHHTTVRGALAKWPQLQVHRIKPRGFIGLAMKTIHRKTMHTKGFIPPPFRNTMTQPDPRLPELTNGLGVVVDGRARYYPMATLSRVRQERWGERTMTIGLDPLSGTPSATWEDGTRPMQLLSRWYGFSKTFPDCEIAETPEEAAQT